VEREETLTSTEIEGAAIREAIKNLTLEVRDLRRDVEGIHLERAAGSLPEVVIDFESRTYRQADPRVSVLVSLFNYEDEIAQALDSVIASDFNELEIIILDDASTDGSRLVVRRWLEAHEHIPAVLARHPVNRGLPRARNSALAAARAEFCVILDADNELYPNCIGRLVEAVVAESAAFAYGILERFNSRGAVGLQSYFAWDPERLANGNYIDAQALIRTADLRELGGYSTDRRVYGWEDYDLWCKMAVSDRAGAFVPEILGRYRVATTSMLALTNLSTAAAMSVLRDRYPTLFDTS
jgi:glycosyl transferase family 2